MGIVPAVFCFVLYCLDYTAKSLAISDLYGQPRLFFFSVAFKKSRNQVCLRLLERTFPYSLKTIISYSVETWLQKYKWKKIMVMRMSVLTDINTSEFQEWFKEHGYLF